MQKSVMDTQGTKELKSADETIRVVECYDAALLGAPFKVLLYQSVQQWVSNTGEVLRTAIPNLNGLRKAVAAARCLHPRKLQGSELKFIRKAMAFKAVDLAAQLDISAEHLSRCENGDRVLSGAAEKLLRAHALRKSHVILDVVDDLLSQLDSDDICNSMDSQLSDKVDILREKFDKYRLCVESLQSSILDMSIESAFDPAETLEFSFRIKDSTPKAPEEEGRWQPAKAA
jgi:DNA-binding transcriptional regulator YiaG